jgi:hypothetical protein
MAHDPPPVLRLLKKAATLKAAGYSWESVAQQLKRAPRTVRQWPDRYPDVWNRLLCEAEDRLLADVSGEAVAFLRKMQRSKNEAVSSQVNRYLHTKRLETRRRPPPDDDATSEFWKEACRKIEAMSEEEQQEALRHEILQLAPQFGLMPIPETVNATPAEPRQLERSCGADDRGGGGVS